jgi:hypothetical protein
MAGTSPILTLGFGPWGGVELLPTLGFGIGAEAVVLNEFYDVSITQQRVTDCTITQQRVTDCTITQQRVTDCTITTTG